MPEWLGARVRTAAAPLFPLTVLGVLWELLARSGLVSERLMPSLPRIFEAFYTELLSGQIIYHASISLVRALSGFGLAIVVGLLLGVWMARSRLFEALVEPIFSFGYPVPKIALYPLFILALGFGSPSKIALIFLECLFPIALNSYFGFRTVDRKYLWSAANTGASRARIFFQVLVPAAAPTIFSGIRVALPIALVVVILTEMIGDSSGLGYFISYSTASFTYDLAYAGILSIACIGFVLDRSLVFLRNRIVFWEHSGSEPMSQ